MKYSVDNYVEAFSQALKDIPQHDAVDGLMGLLKKTGDINQAKKIFSAIHKKLVNEKGGKWVDIEVARESASVEDLKHKFSEKDNINVKISPELIAGTRITVNGEEELDNSLQNKLNKLFK